MLRVIAGQFRGRLLKTPSGLETRPTPDRLRESLFSIIAPRLEGAVFADVYAGSGAVGIEALSRGAARAVFFERSRPALQALGRNLAALGLLDRARVLPGRAAPHLEKAGADIFFIDPPYAGTGEYDACLNVLGRRAPALVIVQHATRHRLEDSYGTLHRARTLRQGDNSLSFYEPAPDGARRSPTIETSPCDPGSS